MSGRINPELAGIGKEVAEFGTLARVWQYAGLPNSSSRRTILLELP